MLPSGGYCTTLVYICSCFNFFALSRQDRPYCNCLLKLQQQMDAPLIAWLTPSVIPARQACHASHCPVADPQLRI